MDEGRAQIHGGQTAMPDVEVRKRCGRSQGDVREKRMRRMKTG